MLLLVRKAVVEVEKMIRTIKAPVRLVPERFHPRKFAGILGGSPSTKMTGL